MYQNKQRRGMRTNDTLAQTVADFNTTFLNQLRRNGTQSNHKQVIDRLAKLVRDITSLKTRQREGNITDEQMRNSISRAINIHLPEAIMIQLANIVTGQDPEVTELNNFSRFVDKIQKQKADANVQVRIQQSDNRGAPFVARNRKQQQQESFRDKSVRKGMQTRKQARKAIINQSRGNDFISQPSQNVLMPPKKKAVEQNSSGPANSRVQQMIQGAYQQQQSVSQPGGILTRAQAAARNGQQPRQPQNAYIQQNSQDVSRNFSSYQPASSQIRNAQQQERNEEYQSAMNQVQNPRTAQIAAEVVNLGNTNLQGFKNIYKDYKIFDGINNSASFDKFDYKGPTWQPVKNKARTGRQDLLLQQQLHLLPHRAPDFVKRVLDSGLQSSDQAREHNLLFQKKIGPIAKNAGLSLAQLILDGAYWKNQKPPAGFMWSDDRQMLVIKPENKLVAALWPQGIAYKMTPSVQQYNQKINFLNNSYNTVMQSKNTLDADLLSMLKGAQALGFNPHLGAISKNSPSIYIGAFIDPFTGNIRTLPKPSLKDFNPVDRDSILQYKVLKAMYTWNTNMRAMEQLKKFMNQSDRGWKATLRNKRKNANVLQRQRNQYKNIARKLALGLPIYGYDSSTQPYQNLEQTWGNSQSSISDLKISLENFVNGAAKKYIAEVKRQAQNFPKQNIGLGNIVRAKVTSNFKQAPYDGAKAFLDKTLVKPMPLGKTKLITKQKALYGNIHEGYVKDRIDNVKRLQNKFAFDTLKNMRKAKRHAKYNLQGPVHLTTNEQWGKTYDLKPQYLLDNTRNYVRQLEDPYKNYQKMFSNNMRKEINEEYDTATKDLENQYRTVEAQRAVYNNDSSETQIDQNLRKDVAFLFDAYVNKRLDQAMLRQTLYYWRMDPQLASTILQQMNSNVRLSQSLLARQIRRKIAAYQTYRTANQDRQKQEGIWDQETEEINA